MKKSKIDGALGHRIDELAASLYRRGFLAGLLWREKPGLVRVFVVMRLYAICSQRRGQI